MATDLAPVHTELLSQANMLPKGTTMVSSIDAGGNLYKWGIFKLSEIVKAMGLF